MHYRKCEVCGMRAGRAENTKRKFMAKLPLDKNRCREWVKVIGKEDLAYMPIEKLHTLKYVCGDHFRDKDFNRAKTQLKKTAVPSVCINADPLTEEMLKDFPYYLATGETVVESAPAPDTTHPQPSTSTEANNSNEQYQRLHGFPCITASLDTTADLAVDNCRGSGRGCEGAIKDELHDKDIDIGPIVLQRMDCSHKPLKFDKLLIKTEVKTKPEENDLALSQNEERAADDYENREHSHSIKNKSDHNYAKLTTDSATTSGGKKGRPGAYGDQYLQGRVRGGRGKARQCRIFHPEQQATSPESVSMPASPEPATLERMDSKPSTVSYADQLTRVRQQQAMITKKKETRYLMLDATTAYDVTTGKTSGNTLLTLPSTGVVKVENQKSGDLVTDNIVFDWDGFTPTATRSPRGWTSQLFPPVAGPLQPSSLTPGPSQSSSQVAGPSGISASKFSAMLSDHGQGSPSPLFPVSPVPGSSQTSKHESPGPAIFEDDYDDWLEEWERGADPGSSDEETIGNVASAQVGHLLGQGFPAFIPDDISPEISERIQAIEACDDADIRGNVSDNLLNFDWRGNADWFEGVREEFRGQAGPTFPLSDMGCPLDAFRMIWDDDIISLIVVETNRYAERLIRSKESQQVECLNQWKPLTTEELWVFLAVCMIQSLVPLPVEKEYWRAFISVVSMQQFPRVMTFNRFKLIKKCLHFADSDMLPDVESPVSRKLFKILPVINHLNNKFSSLYLPGQEIALDDSLLQWERRLNFAQRITTKAAGVGIKSYELCESKTGYLWKFQIYAAQDKPDGMTSRIVHDLTSPLFNRGHTLVMDNFYNTPLLSRCLKLNGMDTMGTLRLNREFVPDSLKMMAKSQLRVGEFLSSQTEDLTVLLWRDTNPVALISSFHPVFVGRKEKCGIYRYKPQVVLDYNLAMGAVDKKDQLLSAYLMERIQNRVWYKKLFHRLLNISILNSSILYGSKVHMTERRFRQSLVTSILSQYMPHLTSSVPAQLTVVPAMDAVVPRRPKISGGHYLERGKPRACCVLCRSRTIRQCDICEVALCVDICFKKYHTS